jgi:glutamate synthase (NADPH/NADH) small chain
MGDQQIDINQVVEIRTKTTTYLGVGAANDHGMACKEGVFAGGDIVTGAATVILAMGAGKKSATKIHEYVQNKRA